MLLKPTLILHFVIFVVLDASTVNFINGCQNAINVIRTVNEQAPVSECNLGSGASCSRGYSSNGMNFKNGWNGRTLAEFSFNSWCNTDFYDISVIVGFDVPMQIRASTGGPTVTCLHASCQDAYLFPANNTKTRATPTGGVFNVIFCP